MALPTEIPKGGLRRTAYGVSIAFSGGDETTETEVQRTSDASGAAATSAWQTVTTLMPGDILFREVLEHTTQRHWYRARHISPAFEPGAYTTEIVLQTAQLTGTQDDNVWSEGQASVTKTQRIPATACVAQNETLQWEFNTAGVLDSRSLSFSVYLASILVPKGVTISGFAARMFRGSSDDFAEANLRRGDSTGGSVALATLTHATSGWATVQTSTLSQLVGDENYVADVSLDASTDPDDAAFLFFELTYAAPSYDKAL